MELHLTFYSDPKWRIVTLPGEAPLEHISDDQHKVLKQPAALKLYASKPNSPIWQMRGTIPGVRAGCARLSGLKGRFAVVLLEQSDPAEIADVMQARNASRRAGKQSLFLQEVTKESDGQGYHVKLLLSRNGLSPRAWRQAREAEGIRLLDARGRAMTRVAFEARETGDQVLYDLTYFPAELDAAAASTPHKLVWQMPLEPREVTVPFEFGQIPVEK